MLNEKDEVESDAENDYKQLDHVEVIQVLKTLYSRNVCVLKSVLIFLLKLVQVNDVHQKLH